VETSIASKDKDDVTVDLIVDTIGDANPGPRTGRLPHCGEAWLFATRTTPATRRPSTRERSSTGGSVSMRQSRTDGGWPGEDVGRATG
jgi:hypothetical protein